MDPTVDACMEVLSVLTANPNHWPENLRSQDLPTFDDVYYYMRWRLKLERED